MRKEKLNQNEQGRSMVEMLGVLAIMGLLTIIGIAGFRIALNKHYANQTVDRLMRRAVVVAGQANFGQNLSLHEFDENDGEYPIPNPDTLEHNAESFTLTVDGVPQEVCQQIIGMDWKIAKIIPEDCSDTTMKFMFLNDLTDCTGCQPETVDCPPASEIQCGKCSIVKGFDDNNADCEGNENGGYCVRGKCLKCDKGYFWYTRGSGRCEKCDETDNWASTSDYQYACLGKMFFDTSGRLFGCLDPHQADWYDEQNSCVACTNRCFNEGSNSCRFPDNAYQRNNDGTCSCTSTPNSSSYNGRCYYCEPGTFLSTWANGCVTCDDSDTWGTVATYRHHCLGTMYYRNNDPRLYGCNMTTSTSGVDAKSCTECKNSEGVKNRCYLDGTCYLANGSPYYRTSETDGTCTTTAPSE